MIDKDLKVGDIVTSIVGLSNRAEQTGNFFDGTILQCVIRYGNHSKYRILNKEFRAHTWHDNEIWYEVKNMTNMGRSELHSDSIILFPARCLIKSSMDGFFEK